MKQLLEYIIKGITNNPQDVIIEEKKEDDLIVLNLKVAMNDFGTIIGKNGRTIRAIRDILRIKAQNENTRFNLTLEEPKMII